MMMPLVQFVAAEPCSLIAVGQYTAMMGTGWVTVSRRRDGLFQILDGNHRTEAARRLGRSSIDCEILA
jgi:hypothetical protein